MSRAQVQAVSVLEDSRLDADGVLCPEVHDWIARVVTVDDVIEALRRRPEVGRALAARLVIAEPWSTGSRVSARYQLWPNPHARAQLAAAVRYDSAKAIVHAVARTGNAGQVTHHDTVQQAHQWCDEQLLARGVVLLDKLGGGR